MVEKCLCEPNEIMIFPCSGGSNVGQIANEAAKSLTTLGKGKMYCLAGIGGHISNLIESTKAAKKIIAIDGCPVQCAKKTLEHAEFNVDTHVVVTELGIKKSHDFMMDIEEIDSVIDQISSQI
ncbi:MAG: putative zinc-binding protein [Thermoplasmata archaeon]|nr:MAG: putative zinc-binding protein [Thermoplasmata archaeon]